MPDVACSLVEYKQKVKRPKLVNKLVTSRIQ